MLRKILFIVFLLPLASFADSISFDNANVYFSGLWLTSSGYTYYTIQDSTGTCASGTLYSSDTSIDFVTSGCHTYFNSAYGNYVQISTGNEDAGNPYYNITFYLGCRDVDANNYQTDWTIDTGACTYDEEPPVDEPMATSTTSTMENMIILKSFFEIFAISIVLSYLMVTKLIVNRQ